MSLMATSYRFEVESGKAKALQKALGRQDVRVKVTVTNELTIRYESNLFDPNVIARKTTPVCFIRRQLSCRYFYRTL